MCTLFFAFLLCDVNNIIKIFIITRIIVVAVTRDVVDPVEYARVCVCTREQRGWVGRRHMIIVMIYRRGFRRTYFYCTRCKKVDDDRLAKRPS